MTLPRRSSLTLALVFLAVCAAPGLVSAQETLPLKPVPTSGLWIDGTSNRSNWTAEAKELSGQIRLDGTNVVETELTVPVKTLESGRARLMDKAMHKALKSEAHEIISFSLSEPAALETTSSGLTLTAKGTLTIGGAAREIEIPITASRNDDGSLTFTGQYTLLMTDFGLEPPTLMFGALHTGDEVTVRFSVVAGK